MTTNEFNLDEFEIGLFTGHIYRDGKQTAVYRNDEGYAFVRIGQRKRLRTGRLVYMYFYGDIPDNYVIDHKDNNQLNDSPFNLQAITQSENVAKEKKPKSGHHNIYIRANGKYSVQVRHKGPQKTFVILEEAIAYRDKLLLK